MHKFLLPLGALAAALVVGCAGTTHHADASTSGDATGAVAPVGRAAVGAKVEADAAGGSDGSSGSATAVDVDAATATKQIRTGTVAVVTSAGQVAKAADRAAGIAEAAGGSVDEQRDTGGRRPSSDLVLKVPPGRLHDVMARLARLGTVRSSDEQTEDVTGQYADLDGRLATLRISVARLQGFLDKATDANQIAQLEGELTRRESDLESMQGQIDALSGRIAQATVHLTITTRNAPVAPVRHDPPSPASALARGWSALAAAARWGAAGLAVSLPFLVLLVGGLAVARALLGRRGSRRAQAA